MMAAFLVITASVAILAPMARALHTSGTEEVWVASIYSLVVSCLVLTAATVGDVIGRRRVFATGVFVLGLGSLLMSLFSARHFGRFHGGNPKRLARAGIAGGAA